MAESSSPRISKKEVAFTFFLAVLTWVSFWQTLDFEFLNYDDPEFVQHEMVSRGLSWDGFWWSWTHVGRLNLWHPVTWWSLQLDSSWGNDQVTSFRIHNLLIHACNSVLVYFLAKIWLKSAWLAFFVALLFVVHPSGVQSVAWISERKGLLASFFMLVCLLVWNQWLQGRKRGSYLVALLMALFACLCKPIAVILPFLLLIQKFQQQGQQSKRDAWWCRIKPLLPFAILSLSLMILTVFLHAEGELTSPSSQRTSLFDRILLLPSLGLYYLQSALYGLDHRLLVSPPEQALQLRLALVFILILVIVATWLYFLKKHSFLPLRAFISALILLAPVSGVIFLSHYYVADRYLYLPRIYLWIGLVALCRASLQKWLPDTRILSKLAITLAVSGIVLSITSQQTVLKRYQNSLSLFSYESQQEPFSLVASLQYANALSDKKRHSDAARVLQNASIQAPKNYEIHFNLGLLHLRQNKINGAIKHFHQATQARKISNPDAHLNLAILLGRQNRYQELAEVTEAALLIFPNHSGFSDLNERAKKAILGGPR